MFPVLHIVSNNGRLIMKRIIDLVVDLSTFLQMIKSEMKSNKFMFGKVLLSLGIRDYLMVRIKSLEIKHKLFHLGNFPNNNNQFRIVQYIALEPAKEDDERERTSRIDALHMRRLCSKADEQLAGFPEPQLTELGEKIIGIRSWKTNEKLKSSFE